MKKNTEKKETLKKRKLKISKNWIVEKLTAIIEICLEPEPVFNKQGEETGRYIFHTSEALKALELLGKSCGLFLNSSEKPNEQNISKNDLELLKKVSARILAEQQTD